MILYASRKKRQGCTMSGAKHRRKGNRVERELVALHKAAGVHAERYPLSGASRFRDSGHDLDIYALGRDAAPLVVECKARKNGAGFTTLAWGIRRPIPEAQQRRPAGRAAVADLAGVARESAKVAWC
jgi:hypothetical protein